MTINKKVKYTIIIILIILVAGAGIGIYLWNKPPIKVESKEGIALTADQLCFAFNKNEAEANSLYLNKAIQVKGQISQVVSNLDGGSMVIIATTDGSNAVQCAMRKKKEPFKKGEKVTIKGFCSGNTITGVALTGCVLIP